MLALNFFFRSRCWFADILTLGMRPHRACFAGCLTQCAWLMKKSPAFSSALLGCQSCGLHTSRSRAEKCPQLLHFLRLVHFLTLNIHVQIFFFSFLISWKPIRSLLACCHSSYLLNVFLGTAGPGPGRYGLPPTIGFVGHDYTKPTSPAYSFHGRMTDTSKFFTLSAFKLTQRQNTNAWGFWYTLTVVKYAIQSKLLTTRGRHFNSSSLFFI